MIYKRSIFTILFLLAIAAVSAVQAQTPETGLKPSVVSGEALSVDAAKIVIKTKDGAVEAVLSAKTEFKRVLPDNPSLKSATPASLTDIAVGDKVLATGILAAGGKSFPARSVYLMTKSDISQKQAKEAEQWRTRGITGRVTAVNSQTNQITVEIRGLTGTTTTTVLTPKPDAIFHRYAPDSIRFDQAKDSSIAEVRQGDMIRALGDKSADGSSFSAEQVVSGAFQTIAGTVKSIDTAKNELVITDLQTKKDVTIALSSTSMMKKFPAEMAERLAGVQTGGAGGMRPPGQQGGVQGRPVTPGGQGQPGAGAPGQGRPGFGGQRGAGSGGIDDMLDRFPSITAADLKVGEMIAVSSTKNGNTARVNAIKLLAGVEPFLRMAQATAGRGGRGEQGVSSGFTIPGLDGIGFP